MYRLPKYLGVVSTVALLGMAGAAFAGPTIQGTAALDAVLANDDVVPGTLDRLCTNNGSGTLTCADTGDTLESNEAAVGDFNGDGYADFALAARAGSAHRDRICLNNTSGGFVCSSFNVNDTTRGMAVGDLDNDGDLDTVMVNGTGTGFDQVCLNNGSAVFVCSSFNANGSLEQSVALGDLDGDGDLDLVIANGQTSGLGGEELICLNNGSAVFSCATFGANDISTAVAIGDVDGDGDLDAVVVGNAAGGDKICLNNGSAVLSCASFNTADSTASVALGDLNNDGDLDIVLANSGTGTGAAQRDRVCTNNGSGVFSCASFSTDNNASGGGDVALGDMNGDGYLDIVLANDSSTVTDRLCLNNGSGGFSSCTSFNTLDNSLSVALGRLRSETKLTGSVSASVSNLSVNPTPLPGAPGGTYTFDAKFCNNGVDATGLHSRIVKITNGSSLRSPIALTAPEARDGGIGAETTIGNLLSTACTTVTYTINLRNATPFKFFVDVFGTPSADPDSAGTNDNHAPPLELVNTAPTDTTPAPVPKPQPKPGISNLH